MLKFLGALPFRLPAFALLTSIILASYAPSDARLYEGHGRIQSRQRIRARRKHGNVDSHHLQETTILERTQGSNEVPVIYQAELFTSKLACTLNKKESGGHSGNGYMKFDRTGSYLEWDNIHAPTTGEYSLSIRYALLHRDGSGSQCYLFRSHRQGNLFNGAPLQFADTGGWRRWSSKSVTMQLAKGDNTIRIELEGGVGPHVDFIQVTPILKAFQPPRYINSPQEDERKLAVTYMPGVLTNYENGLFLSKGLKSRIIATVDKPVRYKNGQYSSDPFHANPDGAGTFLHPNGKHWAYVSNSEVKEATKGGVGSILFDENGNVINYQMVLTNSTWNCAGGETPWNTWLSCEEHKYGQIYEVNPFGDAVFEGRTWQRTELSAVTAGEHYEAVAVDNRDPDHPVFYYTNDHKNMCEVRRFRPDADVMSQARRSGDYKKVLSTPGTLDYLVLEPEESGSTGTFRWVNNITLGKQSGERYFPNTEGIEFDEYSATLYIVSKRLRSLFALDLDGTEYKNTSTKPAVNGSPDSLKLMHLGREQKMYFTEDGALGRNGIYSRDPGGTFVTLLEGADYRDETSGLAFSPDHKHMYFSIMGHPGNIFDITREDGYRFCDDVLPPDEVLVLSSLTQAKRAKKREKNES